MEYFSRNLPAMYGDHHVLAVRQLLLALPGVSDVYASSAFQVVEVHYDETQLSPAEIEAALEQAGYLGPLPVSNEREATPAQHNGRQPFFRRYSAPALAAQEVRFVQEVAHSGRPLWPCPGLGVIRNSEQE